MNDDHTIRCPACLAEYSRNDAPAEYLRVLHILDPRSISDPKLAHAAHLARLSAEVLAKDKLHNMSKEEEAELMANINAAGTANWPPMMELGDLTPEEQKQVSAYIKTQLGLNNVRTDSQPPLLEQVCLGLQELGVDCESRTHGDCWPLTRITARLVTGGEWRFGHGPATWEGVCIDGEGHFKDQWVSDLPNSTVDVVRISKAIFGWLKRFDYREYRGPGK